MTLRKCQICTHYYYNNMKHVLDIPKLVWNLRYQQFNYFDLIRCKISKFVKHKDSRILFNYMNLTNFFLFKFLLIYIFVSNNIQFDTWSHWPTFQTLQTTDNFFLKCITTAQSFFNHYWFFCTDFCRLCSTSSR